MRVVKIGESEYHTMDNDEHDPSIDFADGDDVQHDDVWLDEDVLQFSNVPEELWSDAPIDVPPGPPDPWIGQLADQVEIARLLDMGVLQKRCEFHGRVERSLTTRFVYDWRLKSFEVKCEVQDDGSAKVSSVKRWMRRSRFVAREFAVTKRDDVYSPATGCHTSNLIPIIFSQMLKQLEMSGIDDEQYGVILAALDIKDAFLQTPQEHAVAVVLNGVEYVVLRNLPGQRLGSKAWCWHFRQLATSTLGFERSAVQPCLARCQENVFMQHVDDLLFAGRHQFWSQVFLPLMKSFNELGGPGTEISFLKRCLIMASDGLILVPGTTVSKVVESFEQFFGSARLQKIPCDTLQQDDSSQLLSPKGAKNYRSIIGVLLYLSRDRVDIMFSVKGLSSSMSAPTLCPVQRSRKLVGFLKNSGDIGIKLDWPEHGSGKWKKGTEA
eukprot:s395_g1.t1